MDPSSHDAILQRLDAAMGVVVFPFIWGLTEQMTYNSYLVSRFQILFRKTLPAVVVVAFAWSLRILSCDLCWEV